MTRTIGFQQWYHRMVARGHARRLQQPAYPFAGTVHVLRRAAIRLNHPLVVGRYCDSLPNNMYCHVDTHSVGWWVLSEHVLWMAKMDRATLDVAFAACSSLPLDHPDTPQRLECTLAPLYARHQTTIAWEQRLASLGALSAEWMRKEKQGVCLPGWEITGKPDPSHGALREPIRTPLRLQRPQRLDVAVPLILHGLWAMLRDKNMAQHGEVAEAWQMACALTDNPWESWQTVGSGRFENSSFGRPIAFFDTSFPAPNGASAAFVDSTFYLDNDGRSHPTST